MNDEGADLDTSEIVAILIGGFTIVIFVGFCVTFFYIR